MFNLKRLFSIHVTVLVLSIISACEKNDSIDAPNQSATENATIIALNQIDVVIGQGQLALKNSKVAVHYRGYLYDDRAENKKGKLFDTSFDLDEPLVFVLGNGQVIKGWDEGIVGMRVGGTRTLLIPAVMAYGEKRIGTARAVIKANSALVFDVELIKVM